MFITAVCLLFLTKIKLDNLWPASIGDMAKIFCLFFITRVLTMNFPHISVFFIFVLHNKKTETFYLVSQMSDLFKYILISACISFSRWLFCLISALLKIKWKPHRSYIYVSCSVLYEVKHTTVVFGRTCISLEWIKLVPGILTHYPTQLNMNLLLPGRWPPLVYWLAVLIKIHVDVGLTPARSM